MSSPSRSIGLSGLDLRREGASRDALAAAQASWDAACGDLDCPLPPCAAPPGPVACIDGACGWDFSSF